MFRKLINNAIGSGFRLLNKVSFGLQRDKEEIVVFNTAEKTENLGDYIIMHYCTEILHELFGKRSYSNISTHKIPSYEVEKRVKSIKYKFVCGTNLLTSHIEEWWNWRLPDGLRRKIHYRNVVLLGVGWGAYQDKCSDYTRMIYRCMLNPKMLHSVRDSYTENHLKSIGIKNVINTGCPTMWRLTPEYCKGILTKKAESVITTVTDYRRDIELDNSMLEILSRNYRNVYLWLQGAKDEEYIKELQMPKNVNIIPRNLKAYEEMLRDGVTDYVGTRLHAGIFALNHKIRSIIIAVDNRAIEIAKDTNLPVVLRENIQTELEERINEDFETKIKIPMENIENFKSQFRKNR